MCKNLDLQNTVMSELNWDPDVAAAHINVVALAGVVTLTGLVDTVAQKRAAEAAAARITGVIAILADIEIRLDETKCS